MTERNKKLSLAGRLRMVAACPDANASLCAEAADAIEQHEAFRQEVSDAVVEYSPENRNPALGRFIIAKPDPLFEALLSAWPQYADRKDACSNDANALRAALEARGLEIREKG